MALGLVLLLSHLLLLTSSSSSDVAFEEDFVHSFLHKTEKLSRSSRLSGAGEGWVSESKYTNAVGVSVENWTNQKLEFPEDFISEGAKDSGFPPVEVPRHSREVGLLAHGEAGSQSRGSLCYLLEDSWPISYICLGWDTRDTGVYVILAVTGLALDYEALLKKELNGLLMKDKMRFYKGTDQYVVALTAKEEGKGHHLVLSIIPQRLDVWAWEKYYKQDESLQRIEVEILPTEPASPAQPGRDQHQSQPGIFERKELLTQGEGMARWLGANTTERALLAAMPGAVAVAVRVENWSQHQLSQPEFVPNYGVSSSKLPLVAVAPGSVQLAVFRQGKAGTGVSGVVRWRIDSSNTVLSLMVSVPYSPHLWSAWVAAGLTEDEVVPDFSAMYSGTPDSSWFVRAKMGHSLEFSNGDLILVVDSDHGTSRPVVRLSVVPVRPAEVAPSITHRLEGRQEDYPKGREGDNSFMALRSSASQCHCPCLDSAASSLCCHTLRAALILLLGIRART